MQVSALARLADLHLENGSWAADGYTVLTRLPAMTRLQLCSNEHLPSCLDQLSGLQALVSRDGACLPLPLKISEDEGKLQMNASMPMAAVAGS